MGSQGRLRQPASASNGGEFARDTRGASHVPTANPNATAGTGAVGVAGKANGQPANVTDIAHMHTAYANMVLPALPADHEPPVVLVLRGLPASGKSTFAKALVNANPAGTVARINNDDLSTMLYGAGHVPSVNLSEVFADLRERTLTALLTAPTTRMVVIDNTNLTTRTVNRLARIARTHNATFTVDDRFLTVPLEECLQRNAKREQPVPENVITGMYRQASRLKPWTPPPLLPPVEPYHNNPELPAVVLVDIDGTLATMSPDRGPYDWNKVHLDTPNPAVVTVIKTLIDSGTHVKVFSGRSEDCRTSTEEWLATHVAPGLDVHMRPSGDNRPDDLIKYDLFNEHVRDKHHVTTVFDDRDQVVQLWRHHLQLPVFQVADGNF